MKKLLMHRLLVLILTISYCLSFFSQQSIAASLGDNEKALNMIADFADRLCKDIPIKGDGDIFELTGSAKAELNEIIKKLARAGIDGAVKYQNAEYEGLLQKDLVDALKSSTDCKLQIWNDLKNKIILSNNSPTPKPIDLTPIKPTPENDGLPDNIDKPSRSMHEVKLVEKISPSSIETRNNTKNKARELFYENNFLFVSVINMSKSKDKKNVLLSLNVANTTSSDIYISFNVNSSNSSNPTLAGNDGTLLITSSHHIHGLPAIYGTGNSSNYSKIFAGKKTNVNIVFHSRETIDAVEFNFSSEMIRFNDNKPIRFSVGISNIRL